MDLKIAIVRVNVKTEGYDPPTNSPKVLNVESIIYTVYIRLDPS